MQRRDFLKSASAACLASMAGCKAAKAMSSSVRDRDIKLCLQWHAIPVQDDFNAKLDYLEANGYAAVEIPTGKKCEWILEKGEAFGKAMKGRKLCCATACGPSRFDYADPKLNDAEVAKFMPVLEMLGELKSTGLIICPARSKPEVGLKELREDFVANTGKRLAEKAAKCGTSIVLEPLQRKETPFLRQVSDAAKMAQEIGKGCTVLADFWHMTWEEPNDRAAILSAGSLLTHVHIASRKNRKIPGSDGAADDYRLGFRGLKEIGYEGAVSLEAGWVPKGFDAKGKPILPELPERHLILTKMCELLRAQWAQA
ncbi:MAG: sugar phosphate isomerase/epimerase [Kiritimatiellae bacterium]|nr:sugar phosphate isomerase/epimerase [Kiritimatiellia bacterium]